MNQSSLLSDEDQDSLFGSPPPSPGRGRSPFQDASAATQVFGSATVVSGAGAGRKNVGAIALPGSHMSCAELPADLPVPTMSLPHAISSSDLSSIAPGITVTPTPGHTPSTTSRSSSRSVPSRASSTASSIPSATASIRKRRTPKAKSLTPAPSAPSITLPGPNQPTPPNFLRSQSSLLGLAGVVGCIKPTRLYTHAPQPTPVQKSHSHTPARGSTPAYPIVLDDDQHTSQIGRGLRAQTEHMSPPIDQLNPEILRSNILSSLTKEKDIFPVLESLVKLLGGESSFPSRNPPPEPFARPYGHDIFNVQSYKIVPPHASGGSPISAVPPPKRRKLKHVPAGAADWDVPFPFAAGEGPEAYHNTWAQDRAKQLMVQLLELVRNATKRAAIKTSKSGEGRVKPRSRPSRSASVEAQTGQVNSTGTAIAESMLHGSITSDSTVTEILGDAMPVDNPCDFLPSSLESPLDPECNTEESCSPTTGNHLGFEEWLSQLQSLLPFQADTSTPESSDLGTQPLASLDSAVSIPAPAYHHTPIVPESRQDQAIDPTLLALSQGVGSPPQSQFATPPASTFAPDDVSQVLRIPSTSPVLSHTPRTSFSSITGPPTPPSEAFVDAFVTTTTHGELVPDSESLVHEPGDESCWTNGVPASALSPFPMESLKSSPTAQKGKARADVDIPLATASTSSQPPSAVSTTSNGTLDKHAILERARARRRQLVAEIERAKLEMRETSIEGAMLLRLTRDRPS